MSHEASHYDPPRTTLLTISEAAGYLRCSRRTVERLIAAGDLSPLHVGTRRRLRLEELDRYTERDREPAP